MVQAQTYRERSKAFLVKAREEFEAGDLEQASEKAWGAAALIVKAVAEQNQVPHVSHNGLWDVVDDLSRQTGDRQLRRLFHVGNGLHKNFYENRLQTGSVEDGIDDMVEFTEKMDQFLSHQP